MCVTPQNVFDNLFRGGPVWPPPCASLFTWQPMSNDSPSLESSDAPPPAPSPPAPSPPAQSPPDVDGKPRAGLRAAIGVLLVLGMLAGWAAMGIQKAGRQADAVAVLRAAGASVYFDYQWKDGQPVPHGTPPEAAWLRRLLGDDFFDRAVAVDLRQTSDPDALAHHLLLLPYLTHINAADTRLTDVSLSFWRRMPGLTSIDLSGTQITAAGIQPLRRMPNLKQLRLERTVVAEEPE